MDDERGEETKVTEAFCNWFKYHQAYWFQALEYFQCFSLNDA